MYQCNISRKCNKFKRVHKESKISSRDNVLLKSTKVLNLLEFPPVINSRYLNSCQDLNYQVEFIFKNNVYQNKKIYIKYFFNVTIYIFNSDNCILNNSIHFCGQSWISRRFFKRQNFLAKQKIFNKRNSWGKWLIMII